MNTETAVHSIGLIGKNVRPAFGSEPWAFAKGRPKHGVVVDVLIDGIDHTYLKVKYPRGIAYQSPHDIEVVTDLGLNPEA